ncbi:MAG: tetratricopeptide repeat protein [Minicystis sp.]
MQRVDVLIVTAIREEYAAVRAVDTGAVAGSAWEARTAPTGLEMRVRPFVAAGGGVLWVAVTQALGMGGVEAVSACAQLVATYQVRCLAMCGVCAGRRGEVALGDVIIADRMWAYDTGKREVEIDEAGQRVETERGDIEMYRIAPPAWKQAAERFVVDPATPWLANRPRSYEAQGDWVLERVLRGMDPVADAESKKKCADFGKVLDQLWAKKLLRNGKLVLTKTGKAHIERVLLLNRGELPEPPPFRTHVGPMASGNRVMEDPGIFEELSTGVRKVLGLEMEAAAIGGLAWARGLEHVVVMKGVMDHADASKNDNFKGFAARASAECLLQFMRANLPVVGDAEDPILVRETSPLPEKFGPAALLNARHAVVGFVGREALLETLQAWCEREGRVGARLVHAAGGMGKTRLAMELCKRMRAAGWRVGFVPKGLGVDRFAALVQSDEPVLAVIDYAEGRGQLGELLEVAAARRGEDKSKKKLRVLLLARNAEEWWADLRRSDGAVKALLSDEPVELKPVGMDREAVFREAVQAFARAQNKKVPEVEVPNLADSRYERVLYVHMAALAAVEGGAADADRLMEDTLDHEERFWRQQLPVRAAVDDMRRVVAAMTLVGGIGSATEARAMVGLICGAPDRRTLQLLRDLYPGGPTQYASGLEPDLVGEAMVWRVLSMDGADAGPYLDRVFEGATDQALRTGFAVLGRLSEDHKEADGWIARVLGRDVAGRAMEAFAAAKSVAERTPHAALGRVLADALKYHGTVELAKQLDANLPHPGQTVSLLEVGRWALATQLENLPEGMSQKRAQLLNNLSLWQSALGQREAALASAKESVVLYRQLTAVQPEIFLPSLASSLNNLGVTQSDMGQWEASLDSTQEAVNLYRRLAEARPEEFSPGLATSLQNLGNRQSDLGHLEIAVASSQEAVTLHERLAKVRPEASLPALAMNLISLGANQRALGHRERAVASTQKAVVIYERLVEKHPDAFLPALALSLSNLGAMQSELGQRETALASTQKAVVLYRQLAKGQGDAFLPDLAMSLNNLGAAQSALGQREAALTTTTEAVALSRRLAERLPDVRLPDLATGLNNLGVMQSSLGQHEAAMTSIMEAVALYRRLAEPHPDTYLPDLARSLGNLALRLHELNRVREALPVAEEALDLLWPYFERSPEAHGDLTGSLLSTTANLLKALNWPPDKRWTQRMNYYLAVSGS